MINTKIGTKWHKGYLKDNTPHAGKAFGIGMLLLMSGDRERTEAEFADLLGQAGWKVEGITPAYAPVELIKARRI